MVYLQMYNQLMKFKIDSGAVTVIAETDYLEAREGPLQSPMTILSSIPLSVSGKFRGQLQKGDKVSCEDIFIFKDL